MFGLREGRRIVANVQKGLVFLISTHVALLGFILIGAFLLFAASWRRALLVATVPLYYFIFQSFIHTEFRYTLPMQYFLFVFAATVWTIIGVVMWRAIRHTLQKYRTRMNAGIKHGPGGQR